MKTIDDVIKEYPDGWPSAQPCCFEGSKGNIFFGNVDVFSKDVPVFTREEYEQALKEKSMDNKKVDWFDYDKQEVIKGETPANLESVMIDDKRRKTYFFIGLNVDGGAVLTESDGVIIFFVGLNLLKPLNHDQFKTKIIDMSSVVNSGINCEFKNTTGGWTLGKLHANYKN